MKKDEGFILLAGLLESVCSRARSHYCSTRELLAARFPSWPVSLLLRQPGSAGFLQPIHVDAKLSADTCSTQATIQQDSQPQIIHYTKPPCSRITGKRHKPGKKSVLLVLVIFVKNYLVSLHGLMCYLLTGTFLSPSYAADYFTM